MQLIRQSDGEAVTLNPGSVLGAGGEARVFDLPSDTGMVAKVFRRPSDHRAQKLAVMLANPPADPMAGQGHVSIAWPVDLLVASGADRRTVGYLMPKAAGTRP